MLQKRKMPGWKIPLYFAALTTLISVVLIIEALNSDGTSYYFPFVGYGGTLNVRDSSRIIFTIVSYSFAVCSSIAVSVFQREKVNINILEAILYAVIFSVQAYLGAKLLFCIEKIINCQKLIFRFDGQSLFGGLYISFIYIPFAAKILRVNTGRLFCFSVPIFLFHLIFSRLACFINGCCGTGIYYSNDSPVVFPVQLFEIIFDLFIFSICLRYEKREVSEEQSNVFPLLMLLYCTVRFFLEFIRLNEKLFLIFTIGQMHCVLFIIISSIWIHKNGENVRGVLKKAFSHSMAIQ